MIKNKEPLSMPEIQEYLDKKQENEAQLLAFIKKFVKLTPKDAKKIREDIKKLSLIKMKNEYLVKIIDLMPETAEDLNKIFSGISLNEDETKKIIEIVKQFK